MMNKIDILYERFVNYSKIHLLNLIILPKIQPQVVIIIKNNKIYVRKQPDII